MLSYVFFGITFCTMLVINSWSQNVFNMQLQGTPDKCSRCIKEAHSAFLREILGLPFIVVMTGVLHAGGSVTYAALLWEIREESRNQTRRDTEYHSKIMYTCSLPWRNGFVVPYVAVGMAWQRRENEWESECLEYTGSAKKMYTHFNERKLYVV